MNYIILSIYIVELHTYYNELSIMYIFIIYMDYIICFVLGPHNVVLRAFSWFYTQRPLLAGGFYGDSARDQTQVGGKQDNCLSYVTLYCHSSPS